MNQAAFIYQTERGSKQLYKIKDFYREKGAGTRKLQ